MPFMKGAAALRRTVNFLQKGEIMFRNNIKVVTFNFNHSAEEPHKHSHHQGLNNFVFWHLPQLKYKNPYVQLVSFNMMTPTPFVRAFLDDDSSIVIDCDSRSREEIHNHMKTVLGKSEEMLFEEEQAKLLLTRNPANFGFTFDRQCICEVPGQIPCPGWKPLPKHMRGKYISALNRGEIEEIPQD